MSSPHAAGVAALVVEQHPKWSPKAVQAAVKRTATPLTCPADWEPLDDERERCHGSGGRTWFRCRHGRRRRGGDELTHR